MEVSTTARQSAASSQCDYPLVYRMLRLRSLVKKISNPAKKMTGSGECPSLTGNKLLGFQTETYSTDLLGALID